MSGTLVLSVEGHYFAPHAAEDPGTIVASDCSDMGETMTITLTNMANTTAGWDSMVVAGTIYYCEYIVIVFTIVNTL